MDKPKLEHGRYITNIGNKNCQGWFAAKDDNYHPMPARYVVSTTPVCQGCLSGALDALKELWDEQVLPVRVLH